MYVFTFRFLGKNNLFSSCEAELMELMRQIDMMMQSKKSEWDSERKALLAKLELREQEAKAHTAIMEKKSQEVSSRFIWD